jgi:serine/threonine protein kinase
MDIMDGGDVGNLISKVFKQNKRFKEAHLAYLAKKIVSVLNVMHGLELAHCDVKPENMFISRNGRVVLGDFGLAQEGKTFNKFQGTPAYMDHSRLRGENYGCEADFWSLGISLIEMIRGETPAESYCTDTMQDEEELIEAIRASPTPTLTKGSSELIDFVALTLRADYEHKRLETHPFLDLACSQQEFADFIKDVTPAKAPWWRRWNKPCVVPVGGTEADKPKTSNVFKRCLDRAKRFTQGRVRGFFSCEHSPFRVSGCEGRGL